VSRCAKGACGAVGEAGGAAVSAALGRRSRPRRISRFDDVICATPKPFALRLTPLRQQRSGSPRFETKTKNEKKPRNTAWLEMDCGSVEALLHVQRLHRLAKRVHRFLMLAGFVERFSIGSLLLDFCHLCVGQLRIRGERCIDRAISAGQ
jgi:hypothetical protein